MLQGTVFMLVYSDPDVAMHVLWDGLRYHGF